MKTVTLAEIVALVRSGKHPVLTVNKAFYDTAELIYNEGMKTRIVAVSEDEDSVQLTFDGTEFDEYNRSVAQPVWYNQQTRQYDLKYYERLELTSRAFSAWLNVWLESSWRVRSTAGGIGTMMKTEYKENIRHSCGCVREVVTLGYKIPRRQAAIMRQNPCPKCQLADLLKGEKR